MWDMGNSIRIIKTFWGIKKATEGWLLFQNSTGCFLILKTIRQKTRDVAKTDGRI